MLRVQAVVYSAVQSSGNVARATQEIGTTIPLLQQLFAYTCSVYGKLQSERRDYSVPGTGLQTDDVLFGKEELAQLQMRQKSEPSTLCWYSPG